MSELFPYDSQIAFLSIKVGRGTAQIRGIPHWMQQVALDSHRFLISEFEILSKPLKPENLVHPWVPMTDPCIVY